MKLNGLVIKDATLADAPVVLDLQKEAFRVEAEFYNDYTIAPLTQQLEELEQEFGVKTILKASLEGIVVGSVRGAVKDGVCLVERLCVLPEWQNRGIAARLMRELEARFADCQRFELFTGSRSEKNLYFYQKFGYEIYDTVKVNEKLSFVYMHKANFTAD